MIENQQNASQPLPGQPNGEPASLPLSSAPANLGSLPEAAPAEPVAEPAAHQAEHALPAGPDADQHQAGGSSGEVSQPHAPEMGAGDEQPADVEEPAATGPAATGPAAIGQPADEDEEADVQPLEEQAVSDEPPKMNWYILKVQSNREESIREGLQRRVAIAGLGKYFGDIIVPTEMVSEFKQGKKRVVKKKLYPGYLVVHMEINEDTWFLVRETPGIGDFTGTAGKPTPMLAHEVQRILAKAEEKTDDAPKLKINFNVSDRVKINEGTFENFEGTVESIDEASGRVTVMINIFGRSTPVELEYWQVESI